MPTRPRISQVSRHPERLRIELSRLAGVSLDKIAAKYGVHKDSVSRHMASLSPEYRSAIAAGVPVEELAEMAAREGKSLLDHLGLIRTQVEFSLIEASARGDTDGTAKLAREATRINLMVGRLTNEILCAPAVTNVTNNRTMFFASPHFHSLERMISRKLAPFPGALRAITEGICEMQGASTLPGRSDAKD